MYALRIQSQLSNDPSTIYKLQWDLDPNDPECSVNQLIFGKFMPLFLVHTQDFCIIQHIVVTLCALDAGFENRQSLATENMDNK